MHSTEEKKSLAVRRSPGPRARPLARSTPAPQREVASGEMSYVAIRADSSERALHPLSDDLVQALGAVEVKAVPASRGALARSLVELRGYRMEDLEAIAEIGVQYLHAGALVAARTVFEGLTAIAPANPYFVMALGLTYEREGQLDRALESYDRAIKLDPTEGRAEVNAAELLIARRDLKNARPLLVRAVKAASARGDAALENKARALYDHVNTLESKRSSR